MLNDNMVTPAGASYLANPDIFPQVETINLFRNEIGDEGAKALAEALEKVWNYPEMAKQMGKRGRKRVEMLFSWEKVAHDIEKIFIEVTTK